MAIVFATFAILGASYPGGIEQMLLDVRNYDANRKLMESDRVEEGRLDREADRIHLLYVEKMECLEDLVTGRETLRASTLRIIELDRNSPITIRMVEQTYPGATYEEKAARYVFEFLKGRLQDAPAPSGVRERIQQQFRVMFAGAADLS